MGAPHFTVESARLAKVLADLTTIAARGSAIPVAGHALIVADVAAGTLRLAATNMDALVERTITANVHEGGAATINAHRLKDIVGQLEGGSQAEVSIEGSGARLVSGRARFRLSTLPAEDFPPLPLGDVLASFEINAQALRRALATVRHSVCTQEARYWLCGTHMNYREGFLFVATTDGDRLTRVGLPAPAGAEAVPPVTLPMSVCGLIERAAADYDGTARLEIADAKVRVTVGDMIVTGRAIEGTFPDFKNALGVAAPRTATVDRDSLEGALGRILLLSDGKIRCARMYFDTDKLTIRTPETLAEHAIEELPCEYAGDAFTIGFNGQHLRDSLRALDTDTVVFGMGEPAPNGIHPPTILTSPSRTDATLALSPMRV